MSTPNHTAGKGKHAASRTSTLLGVAVGFLFASLAFSVVAADVSVNASAYANNDVIVNGMDSGLKVVMLATTTPRLFDARDFVVKAYPLYAKADRAITSMDKVIMVGWCAKKKSDLNSSMSCLNGSKYNDDPTYSYVFIQMRFPSWSNSTVASPSLVDLSSLNVSKQMDVSSFAGTYNPDKGPSTDPGYITHISYNSTAVYAVFGVLVAVVVIVLIITCVCICKRDNAMADANKSIIDKAITTLRSDRQKSRSGSVNPTNFAEHYNMQSDTLTIGPTTPKPMLPTTAASATGPLSQREGSNTYPSPPDSRTAVEREMQEIKARQAAEPDASHLQKPVA